MVKNSAGWLPSTHTQPISKLGLGTEFQYGCSS